MQIPIPADTLIATLTDIRPGNRYSLLVTGASTAVYLEFEHDGSWFPVPFFVNTPQAGVVPASFIAVVTPMRLRIASASATPWTASWIKETHDTF